MSRFHSLTFTVLVSLLSFLVTSISSAAEKDALHIVAIEIDGKTAESAREVSVTPPGENKAEKSVLIKGDGNLY